MCLREAFGLICLFLAVVTLSITIMINFRPLYLLNIRRLNILKNVKVDRMTLIKSYDHLMIYLNNPSERTLVFPDFLISDSATFYFYEVKKLFLLCYDVLLVTLLPSVLHLKCLMENQHLWTLIRPFQWGTFLPVLFGFFILISFNQSSIAFHGLFSNSDAWLFNLLTDPIINALPEAYFMHCFTLSFVLLEGLFLIGILIGRHSLKK